MSSVNAFGILALASAALAVPFGHENHHAHLHRHEARAPQGTYGDSTAPADPSSSVPPPAYPTSPATGSPIGSGYPIPSSGFLGTGWGTGSAQPTGWYPTVSAAQAGPTKTSTKTKNVWSTKTEVSTIYVTPSPAPAGFQPSATGAAPAGSDPSATGIAPAGFEPSATGIAAAAAAATCAATTVTTKVTMTVTVTPGGGPPAGQTAAAAGAGSPAAPSAPGAPAAAPSSASPAAYAPAETSGAAPASPSSATSQKNASPGLSTGSIANTNITSLLTGGKRGLAYNTASLVTPFIGAPGVGFAYNWVSNSAGLASGIPFIPELHDLSEMFTSVWQSDAEAAIANGAQFLFGFNEPDIPSQANLSPEAAAAAWMQYIQPFAGQVKLVAPAVSNSGEAGQGLDWLQQFMAACSECTFDAVNQHWYDYTSNDLSLFQQQISAAASQSGLPVFVGEFGFIGSDSDISSALEQAMSWMDSNDDVLGYAYYFLDDGLLLDGVTPSAYGATYLS